MDIFAIRRGWCGCTRAASLVGVGSATADIAFTASTTVNDGFNCYTAAILVSDSCPVDVRNLASFRITVTSTPVPGETNSVVSGQSAQVKVEALDNTGAVFTLYRGTVHFSSSDAAASLPGDYTFTATDAGSHNLQRDAEDGCWHFGDARPDRG